MIELCTKKRMLIAITLLGGLVSLTVLVLIVESHWTDNQNKLYLENYENNTACLSGDAYEIISECHPCSAFELASKSIDVCVHARYKEVIKCKSGETITRSCDRVAWLEEKAFWKFEAVMFVLAFSSCISIYWRENVLRQRIIRKVARQLRASAAKMKMNKVYLEIYSVTEFCVAPIETIVTLFTIKYCDSKIRIRFVPSKQKPLERTYKMDISCFEYVVLDGNKVPSYATSCELPIIALNKISYIAGLCAILRQIVKDVVSKNPEHRCRQLLGFKDSCLTACSEASIWTKFCEVDLILALKFLHAEDAACNELPSSMARFECHMLQPVRLRNLNKYTIPKKMFKHGHLLEHTYSEGSYTTLADIIIFVCMHILLTIFSGESTLKLLPLTVRWYGKMLEDQIIVDCLKCLLVANDETINEIDYTLPQVPNQSLYKSDPKRYKPRSRIFTRQEDVEQSLDVFRSLNIDTTLDSEPFAVELNLNWSLVPFDATPEGGALPPTRLKRKQAQLQNMCKPVIKLAKEGDVIVDFCSGSGHLGILLAYLLPDCVLILLENKEESLNRAKERVRKLNLTNVRFYQCNLDYFKGKFDIGLSLHACGVATDLVIEQCIKRRASFVCCPCCYGSLHDCHHLTYPRSDVFRKDMRRENYMVLSHAADQTHDEKNVKTKQGYECMAIVDTDRKILAEQFGYKVYFSKFIPENCTPKNHILVGIARKDTRRQSV